MHSLALVLVPLGAALSLFPFMSSGAALFLGAAIALFLGNPYLDRTRKLTKPMLAWAIVGLGAGASFSSVLKAGGDGVVYTLVSLCAILLLGHGIGRLFRTTRELSALINVGTAICGGSAIAAVSSVIRAKDESISVSLGVVFLLNAVALFAFPILGNFFGLTQEQFGLWSALAIHDTSSVVGATLQYGDRALEVGSTVKLVRALWIIPVALVFAKFYALDPDSAGGTKGKRQYPWFIGGFLLMSALVSGVPSLGPIGREIEWIAKRVLVATLFLIGTGLTWATLKKVGLKTLLHGLTLWAIVVVTSLLIVRRYG